MRLPIVLFQSDTQKRAYSDYFARIPQSNSTSGSTSSLFGALPQAHAVLSLFKKSGLPGIVLNRLWDMIHQSGTLQSSMDQNSVNVGLRLIAMAQYQLRHHFAQCAQHGVQLPTNWFLMPSCVNMNLMSLKDGDALVPWLEGHDEVLVQAGIEWIKFPCFILENERQQYQTHFNQLLGQSGGAGSGKPRISVEVALNFLALSNVPRDMLVRVTKYCDLDKDAHLDFEEFSMSMFYTYQLLAVRQQIGFGTSLDNYMPDCVMVDVIPPPKRKVDKFHEQQQFKIEKIEVSPTSPQKPTPTKQPSPVEPEPADDGYNWNIPTEARRFFTSQFLHLCQLNGGGAQLVNRPVAGNFIANRLHVSQILVDEAFDLVSKDPTLLVDVETFVVSMWMLKQSNDYGVMLPLRLPNHITAGLANFKHTNGTSTTDMNLAPSPAPPSIQTREQNIPVIQQKPSELITKDELSKPKPPPIIDERQKELDKHAKWIKETEKSLDTFNKIMDEIQVDIGKLKDEVSAAASINN